KVQVVLDERYNVPFAGTVAAPELSDRQFDARPRVDIERRSIVMHVAEAVSHHVEQTGAEQPIGASEITDLLASQIAVDMIAEPRDGETKTRFLAAIAIGGDKIVSMSELADESADILRIVLEIAVEHGNPIAARNTHTGSQRGDL